MPRRPEASQLRSVRLCATEKAEVAGKDEKATTSAVNVNVYIHKMWKTHEKPIICGAFSERERIVGFLHLC